MPCANRGINPIAVMQVQNRGRRNCRPYFRLLPIKGRSYEHSDAHQSRVGDFDPDLGGADTRIENRQNVVDPSLKDFIGIRIQLNIRSLSDVHRVEIILVNIADDPNIRKIRDGEWTGARQTLHPSCVGNLLLRDYSGYGRSNVDDSGRMVLINAEKTQLLGRGVQISFGVLPYFFRLFESALGDSALFVKKLGSLELQPCQ